MTTYGEVRRRELFHAMLVAWVLGLALMWRWWARAGPDHPTWLVALSPVMISHIGGKS